MSIRRLMIAMLLLLPALGCQKQGCQQQGPALPAAAATSLTPSTPGEADLPGAAADAAPAEIDWNQLDVGIEADTVFQPWMMKTTIKSLDGRMVRITGFMHGGIAVKSGIREFVLLRNIDCPFGRQGEAHHVIMVQLAGKERTEYSTKPLTVEGTFRVRPFEGPDGNTWALYALDDARVTAAGEAATNTPDSIHNQDGEDLP
jgi:hypothetical protein